MLYEIIQEDMLEPSDIADLQSRLSEFQYVRFTLPDINGIARSKITPVNIAKNYLTKGLGFYSGTVALGTNSELPSNLTKMMIAGNISAKPAIKKIFPLPWAANGKNLVGDILCEPYWSDNTIMEGHSRYVARMQLEKLQSLGYRLYSAFEIECSIFNKATCKPDNGSTQFMTALGLSRQEEMFFEFENKLNLSDINLETISCEYGAGQFEFTFPPAYGVDTADTVFRFKQAMKEMCDQKGSHITFITRPSLDGFSNSAHFNHSLWDISSNKNAFYDGEKQDNLSETALHFIGGLIKHAGAIIALSAPTTSCYRRFCGPVTPAKADWGIDNRFAALRVKNYSQSETYIENRLPSGSCNPYIVMAATLAAGIDGITNKIAAPPQSPNDKADPMPKSLSEALNSLEADDVLIKALGKEFIEWFVYCKKTFDVDKFGHHNMEKVIPEEDAAERANCYEFM